MAHGVDDVTAASVPALNADLMVLRSEITATQSRILVASVF